MKLRYLLVDECQDTNACQYALLRHLTGNEARFTAVGDDDQSIYAWRGADISNLKKLQDDYKNLKIMKLEQNYRSTENILKAANAIIENNEERVDKVLFSTKGDGELIDYYEAQDEADEANFIVSKIKQNSGGNYNRYAILYRTNSQSRALEEACMASGIPYRIYGGLKFYDRKEIKDKIGRAHV